MACEEHEAFCKLSCDGWKFQGLGTMTIQLFEEKSWWQIWPNFYYKVLLYKCQQVYVNILSQLLYCRHTCIMVLLANMGLLLSQAKFSLILIDFQCIFTVLCVLICLCFTRMSCRQNHVSCGRCSHELADTRVLFAISMPSSIPFFQNKIF